MDTRMARLPRGRPAARRPRRARLLSRRPVRADRGRARQAHQGLRGVLSVDRQCRRQHNQEMDALALAADIACPVHVVQPGHDHVASPETYASAEGDAVQARRRRPSGNPTRTPSTASCIARSRPRTWPPPRSPLRSWSAFSRAVCCETDCRHNTPLSSPLKAGTHRAPARRPLEYRVPAYAGTTISWIDSAMNHEDPFRFKLTDEQKHIVATVRELTQGEFKPRGLEYMDGTFPWENIRSLAEARRARHGGAGGLWRLGLRRLRHRAGARGDRQGLLRHRDGGAGRGRRADPHHRDLRAGADQAAHPAGRVHAAMHPRDLHDRARTPAPTSRTTPPTPTSTATALRLNGVKTLISRAEEAGMFVVFTRVNSKPGRDGIGCVLVEKGTPGLVLSGKLPHHGRRISARGAVRGLRAAARKTCCSREDGFKQTAVGVQHPALPQSERSRSASPKARSTRRCAMRASASAFGRPIGEFQGMRWKLADMYNDIEAGARAALSRLRHRRSVPRSDARRDGQGLLQRDVDPRHQRGDPGASAATASPTSTWCRGSIAARATAASAAAPPRRCAT